MELFGERPEPCGTGILQGLDVRALCDSGSKTRAVGLVFDRQDPADDVLGAKLRLVWQRVFIPRRLLAREYNLNPNSIKIYGFYFVRLRDLWRRYRRAGWQLITGEEGAMIGADAEQENKRLRDWMTGAGTG